MVVTGLPCDECDGGGATSLPAAPAVAPVKHCAKFSVPVLGELDRLLDQYGRDGYTLDPFAGVGRVHSLNAGHTVGVELEAEWACQAEGTIIANALHLPFPNRRFRRAISSPTYANRMADCHDAQERCKPCKGTGMDAVGDDCPKCRGEGRRHYKRNTYKHTLGRPLHPDNSGAMQWGDSYRELHVAAWTELRRVLEDRGYFFLNISDHIRGGKTIPVSAWHRDTLVDLGYTWLKTVRVLTPRNRQGANYEARVDGEDIHVFQLREAA